MPKTHFENLKVYQLAEKLADEIWEIVIKWDQLARFRVGQQIVKSADGIGSCIAEGSGRGDSAGQSSIYRHCARLTIRNKALVATCIQT